MEDLLGVVAQGERGREEGERGREERERYSEGSFIEWTQIQPCGSRKETKAENESKQVLTGETESQKSPASSSGRTAVYLEIPGFSFGDLRESAVSGGLVLGLGTGPAVDLEIPFLETDGHEGWPEARCLSFLPRDRT